MLAVAHADAIPWLVGAGVALVAWIVLFALIASATMPRLPDAGPETMELGPEPPAVANFLSHRWEVTTSAIAATLVDLAARGRIAIERFGAGDHLVRVRRSEVGVLNEYESQVLELVEARATNGTVPAAELSLGYGDTAQRWWKRFRDAVIDDARGRGLARRRFNTFQSVLLAVTLAIPFALVGIALEVYGAAERAAGEDVDAGGGLAVAGVAWIVVVAFGQRRLRGWRETSAGSAAAANWLGVRNFLRHDDAFRDTPPAGVAIWDRLLAYGAGLGVAHATAAALPIGPTRDDEGWSPRRGIWREVRIEYPKAFGYGDNPRQAAIGAFLGLVLVVIAIVVVARGFLPAALDAIDGIAEDDGPERWLLLIVVAVFAAPIAWLGYQALRRIVILLRAIPDLGSIETFEGYVVRVPWHHVSDDDGGKWVPMGYVAVDDGAGATVRALRCATGSIREGQTVRVTMTPRLRHVVSMEVVAAGRTDSIA